jgi:hypothetical protein
VREVGSQLKFGETEFKPQYRKKKKKWATDLNKHFSNRRTLAIKYMTKMLKMIHHYTKTNHNEIYFTPA